MSLFCVRRIGLFLCRQGRLIYDKKYIDKSKEYGYHIIGIFFQSVVKDCIERNEKRGGKVPSKAIASTSNILQMPSRAEGFDELFFVEIINNEFELTKWRE